MSSCSSCTSSSSDYRVQTLDRQISDWRNCPTTDSQTKQVKVDKLENEKAAIKKDIEQQKNDSKFDEQVSNDPNRGTLMDIRV